LVLDGGFRFRQSIAARIFDPMSAYGSVARLSPCRDSAHQYQDRERDHGPGTRKPRPHLLMSYARSNG